VLWSGALLVVALPILTWLVFVAFAIAANLACTTIASALETHRFNVVIAYYGLAFPTNALCTILLITKIGWHSRKLRQGGLAGDTHYKFLITLLMESGVAYAAAGAVNLALYIRSSSFTPISAVVFNSMAVSKHLSGDRVVC
jgi:hypothetical protein